MNDKIRAHMALVKAYGYREHERVCDDAIEEALERVESSAIALQAEQAEPGFVMVPVEPDEAFVRRAKNHGVWTEQEVRNLYDDIVAAALAARPSEPPKAPIEPVEERLKQSPRPPVALFEFKRPDDSEGGLP